MNLERQLKTITKTNNYSHDVYDVTTNVRDWRSAPEAETPLVFLVDESTNYIYHAGKLTERIWTIGIYVVMRNSTQGDLEEFLTDIEQCLQENQTLYFSDTGSVCSHHRIMNIVTGKQIGRAHV